MLHDIWQAETREDAHAAFDLFVDAFEAKYPKAAECLIKDRDEMLTFYDFPAQHWQSIRTSNPIESAFDTIRHRTKRTKGCLSCDGILQMMFKLGKCAEKTWRKLRGFAHLADVIQGLDFVNGIKPLNQDQAAWTPDLTITAETFNSDQGSQFTSSAWIDVLTDAKIKISMDGKGVWRDNRMTERLWRSLKYECVYLNAFETGSEMRAGIGRWL